MTDNKSFLTFYTHNNGGRPFKVQINKNIIIINNNNNNNQELYRYKFDNIFIGKSIKNKMTTFSGGYGDQFDGNTILLKIVNNDYIYIGNKIIKFKSIDEIVSYFSYVGNNDVPYPYAIDKIGNYYLINENLIQKADLIDINELLLNDNNPYWYYYEKSKINYLDKRFIVNVGNEQYNINYTSYPIECYNRLTNKSKEKMIFDNNEISENDFINIIEHHGQNCGFVLLESELLYDQL